MYLSICLSVCLSTFSTSQLPKVVRRWCVLYILTSECPWRHKRVHFFDISTSKSGPSMVCFVHFDLEMCFPPQRRALFRHLNFQKWSEHGFFVHFHLEICFAPHIATSTSGPTMVCFVYFDFEMCFAPQRRALFRHLNFQKWSEHGVLCTCSLGNVLRATTACTFSTSQLPKVVRAWCVLYILTWKCASHHNGVHFFDILTSKSGPSMVCFVHFHLEMCFAPHIATSTSGPTILTSKCASRHNGVHFFDISTSKSGPSMVCFVHFHLEMCFAPQRRALFRHLNFQKWSEHGVFCTFSLGNVLRAITVCTFSTSHLPKVVRQWCVLYILTWKCASRHNGVHFFDISTSKSGPTMVCFVHFHLEMCFAPQRRALFRHLNFQKWSDNGVFCTFWLGIVLRATTACTFSTSQLPKVVRHWCVLYILTWKCASRHNGISTSKSGPSMVCFVHFHLEMCFAPQRRALFRHLNFQKWSDNGVFCTFWLGNVLRATTACTFSTSQLPKVVRAWCALYIFTWKCASRHNGVHFFDISTSKSGPTMVCFVHFDLEMCFAPQRRALFRHLNFQKWSEHGVFCTFWLGNVLRATTACTFSTSQLPKVVRHWCVLYILTWKCASRHNGVHFFDISTSKSGPNPSVFNTFYFQMCFAPQRRAIFHLSSGQLAPHPRL